MAILTEGVRTGEFLLSEANGMRSRETVEFMPNGPAMPSGQAVGKVTATKQWGIHDPAATDGREVCAGILYAGLDASTFVQKAVVIARDAVISFQRTTGIDSDVQDDLEKLGIVLRGPTTPFVAPEPQGPA